MLERMKNETKKENIKHLIIVNYYAIERKRRLTLTQACSESYGNRNSKDK